MKFIPDNEVNNTLGLRNSFQDDQSVCFDFKNEKSMNPQVDDKNTKI